MARKNTQLSQKKSKQDSIKKSSAKTTEMKELRERTPEEIKQADEEYIQQRSEEVVELDEGYEKLFNRWEEKEVLPDEFPIEIYTDSLEAGIGYSSLFRQMHRAFIRQVAFNRSPAGGRMTLEEARKEAFHKCKDDDEAKKEFQKLFRLPIELLNFADLQKFQEYAPRVAERYWEYVKCEGQKEFASGHLAANITFPEGYMKGMWNVARYMGVRESFIDEWNPKGGIELSLIDMLAQSWFQWQYWLEQTVRRSQTREREEHPEYSRWMAQRKAEYKAYGWTDGYWDRPYVSEVEAIEHAVKMADRFNRIFMRTLRQLRDLRRYSVTINNANQVNIAADGGQQVNLNNSDSDRTEK